MAGQFLSLQGKLSTLFAPGEVAGLVFSSGGEVEGCEDEVALVYSFNSFLSSSGCCKEVGFWWWKSVLTSKPFGGSILGLFAATEAERSKGEVGLSAGLFIAPLR